MSKTPKDPSAPAEIRPPFSIERESETHRYYVIDAEGRRCSCGVTSRWLAEARIDAMTRNAKARPRDCITCRETFDSEGPHNRMCDPCRHKARGGAGREFDTFSPQFIGFGPRVR